MPQYADGFARFGNNYAVPALFLQMFPSWFVGVAFAAIAIGALVPAAIMSIACANLFTRNIYREYCIPNCSAKHESQVAKIVSMVVKLGALENFSGACWLWKPFCRNCRGPRCCRSSKSASGTARNLMCR